MGFPIHGGSPNGSFIRENPTEMDEKKGAPILGNPIWRENMMLGRKNGETKPQETRIFPHLRNSGMSRLEIGVCMLQDFCEPWESHCWEAKLAG